MGSFHSGGQLYSLMTMDLMRQLPDDTRKQTEMSRNTSFVYIGNSTHVVEPVTSDEAAITEDSGEPITFSQKLPHGIAFRKRVGPG